MKITKKEFAIANNFTVYQIDTLFTIEDDIFKAATEVALKRNLNLVAALQDAAPKIALLIATGKLHSGLVETKLQLKNLADDEFAVSTANIINAVATATDAAAKKTAASTELLKQIERLHKMDKLSQLG